MSDKERRPSVDDTISTGPPWWRSTRFKVVLVGFWGGTNIFIQRFNLSMAIVCMVNHTAIERLTPLGAGDVHLNTTSNNYSISSLKNTSYSFYTNFSYTYTLSDNLTHDHLQDCNSKEVEAAQMEDGEYVWSKDTQGILLGALFWGYVPFQVMGGCLIKRFGLRRTTGPFFIAMSILTMVTPAAAMLSPWAVFSLRMLIGFTNAICLPGVFFILTTWAPPSEKSRMTSIIFAGNMFGNIIVFPVSGALCKYGFAGGWPSIFYVSGISSLTLCVLWYLCVYDNPIKHPSIHPAEKEYMLSQMTILAGSPKQDPAPWCKILTSIPVYAIVTVHTCFNWEIYLIIIMLPLYMREVLNFQAATNGLFVMLPYICMWFVLLCSGVVLDKVAARFGSGVARKSSTIIGMVIPAVFMVVISYLDCNNTTLVIVLLCVTISLLSFNFIGFMVNFFDIAPTHGGQIMTFSNTIANIPGILTPYTTAKLTPDNTREQWQQVFFLSSGIMVFGALVFIIFGQVTVQKWAVVRSKETVILNPKS